MTIAWMIQILLALLLSPLLFGVIAKIKAFFAGRRGPRLLQTYYDLDKLLRKGCVYSQSTTWIFRLAPSVGLAATVGALLLMPLGFVAAPTGFPGDFLLLIYLFGLGRLLTVLSALDSASSFEGMGSSREIQFSIPSEAAFFGVLCLLCIRTGKLDLAGMLYGSGAACTLAGVPLLLAAAAFYLVLLAECCRVPVDDPETHLELTMIHEAMILDNSGPDLALIHYAAGLKLWILAAFLINLLLPGKTQFDWLDGVYYPLLVLAAAVAVGITESIMARYRFRKVPRLLAGAFCMTLAAIILELTTMAGGAQ